MKNLSIYTSLQTQYQKLTQLLRSKGNQLSQFKHQQLLNRINRCSLQMKRVGMGMSVCLALGVGTPVMGQYPPTFVAQTGADNPFSAITDFNSPDTRGAFVDIDGDGDLDFFRSVRPVVPTFVMEYYENIGTATMPLFADSTGTNNLTMGGTATNNIIPTFVDIDNDGDYDCFATAFPYNLNNTTLAYFPNTGTATSPFFSFGTNPLDDVVTTLGPGNGAMPNFVDIDNDGDLDCFVSTVHVTNGFAQGIWYYENTGTASSPIFTRRLGTSNPMGFINSAALSNSLHYTIYFTDMDMDGDKDAIMLDDQEYAYYENTGTASSPVFALNTSTTPLDNMPNLSKTNKILVDIDGDMDLDICAKLFFVSGNSDTIRFFENTSVLTTRMLKDETAFSIYPNPTTGILNFDKPIVGNVILYSATGQKIWGKELYEEQEINLSELNTGIYFLEIETAKERIRKKVVVQK